MSLQQVSWLVISFLWNLAPWTRVNTTKLEANVTDDYYAPPTMDLTVLNSSSILVNWSEPPRHKDLSLKGYRLTYSTEVGKIEDFVFFGPIHVRFFFAYWFYSGYKLFIKLI